MRRFLIAILALTLISATATAYVQKRYGRWQWSEGLEKRVVHEHVWGAWKKPIKKPECECIYIQLRQCTNCGLAEIRNVR